MANFLQDLNNGSFGNPKYIDKFKTTNDTLIKELEQPKEDIKPVNFLNFGPGVSQKGVTNIKDFMVSNKTPEFQQVAPTPEQKAPIQQNGGFSLFPEANANEIDEELVQQFINRGKQLGKTKEEIKIAYDKAFASGIFNKQQLIQEQPVEPLKENKGILDILGENAPNPKDIGEVGLNVLKGLEKNITGVANIGAGMFGVKPMRTPSETIMGVEKATPSLLERSVSNIGKYGEQLGEIWGPEVQKEQTKAESLFQGSTKIGAGVLKIAEDVFTSLIKTASTQEQKDFFVQEMNKVMSTKGGVAIQEEIAEAKRNMEILKEINPRMARNYQALYEGLNLAFESVGFGSAKKGITTGVKTTDNILTKSADKIGEGLNTVKDKIKTEVKEGLDKGFSIPGKGKTAVDIIQNTTKAKTKGGVEFDIEDKPGFTTKIFDKVLSKDNEVLAQQSVMPKTTKEKTLKGRSQSSKTALEGIEQLYEDKAKGIIQEDIKTMPGGVNGMDEGLSYYGKKIGELTNNKAIIDTTDLVNNLENSLNEPFSGINSSMKSVVTNIIDEFKKINYQASIGDLQNALSNIKSEIFSNAENISKLYKTNVGKALNNFLNEIDVRFNETIENTTGNLPELLEAKKAYSKYKKIQKDFTDSLMVDIRNQGKGLTGTAGKIAGLYEVLNNPSMSGVFKAIVLKNVAEKMQYYKTRSGNYETLIRKLDKEALERFKNNNIENDINSNISRSTDTMEPIKALPPGKKEPIITPQTKENAVIQQSKADLQKAKIGTTTPQPKPLKKSPLSEREKALLKKEPQTAPLISGDKTPQVLETPNKDKPKIGFKIGDKRPLKKAPTTAEKVAIDTIQAKENLEKAKEMFKKEDDLVKEAKKYKSADDFIKKFFPIKYEVNTVPVFGKPGKTEKSIRLDLFPKDLIQGKGITQDELLNVLKKEYNNGAKSIYPSLGIWTEQGKGFIDNLVKKGYLDSKYNILSKIEDYEYKNSLKKIYEQSKEPPTKKLLSKEKIGFKLPKDFNINKSKYEKKNNISEQKSEIEQNTEVMGSENSKGDNSKNESGNNKAGPRNGNGLLEGPIKELTGKKERDVANNKAIKILEDKNYSENYNNYTKEEIEALKQYTGVGGLNVKSDTGVGALSEFYTPTKIVDKMWGIVNKLGIKGTGYEPSIGIGKFFNNIPENIKLNGGELSKISGTIAKILNPDSNIKIGDFQDMFMSKNNEFSYSKADYTGDKYELIIGNPPYFKRGGAKAKVDPHLSQSEDYFVSKGLDMLRQDGVLVYIVKNGFLGKNSTANLKAKIEIANKGHLIGAYRLPSGMFKDTPISTEIIVIKKEKGNLNDFIEDNYFKNNPQNLLYDKIIGEGQFKRFTGDDSYLEKIGQGLDNKLMEHNYYKETTTVYAPKESFKTVEQVIEPKKQFLSVEKEPLKVIENGKENKEILKTGLKLEVEGYTEIPKGRGSDLNYMDGDIYINDFYKSGNIYNRLQQLEIDKDFIINKYGETQYLKQKKELESVLPKPKKVKDISFTYKDEKLVANKGNNGTIGEMFYKFIQNKSLPYGFTRWDIMDEFRGNRITVKKEQRVYLSIETNKLFNDFMHNNLDDFDLIKQIEDNYNKKINGYVEPDYSKIELVLDGITDKFKGNNFEFSEIQKNGIKKLVNKGVGLIAYGVGVGKTHTIIGAVKSTMDLGRSKRPVIIVPSSTLPAWVSTIKETIPGIKVNNFGGFTAPQMQKLIKEKGNDYTKWIKDGEITVITHEGIDKIGATQQDILELTDGLGDTLFTKMGNAKDIETRGQKVEEILSDIYGKSIEGLTIDHLGIDLIAVDEVHNFRKVFAKAEIQGDGGNRYSKLDGSVSKGAQKLFALTQKILRQNNGRNVYLASATPFENKPTEVYNILSLIAYNELKSKGLNNINDFFTYFAKFKTEFQKKVNGEWADKEVFHEYGNIDELQTLIREYMDFKEDLTLVRPNKIVETPKLEMSDLQKENLKKIISISKDSKRDGALLTASTYGKQNSVSPYFIDEFNLGNPTAKELVENSPKLNFAYESIKKMKEVHKDKGSLIYLGSSGTKYFETYKQHFVDTGVYNSSEIGVINGDTPKDKRELIADGFRKGNVKLIIGGDPTKEGINLQDNGIMTYILNLGWNPTEMTQVEGRVWRQGNPADKVGVIYPLLYNSNDTIMFQKFKEKGGRIASLIDYTKKYEDNTNLELDPQEQLLNLTTDPKDKVIIKMGLLKKDYNNELLTYKNTAKTIDEVFNTNHEAKLNIEKSNNELDRYKRELQSDIDNKTNFYNEDLWKSKIKGLKDEIKKFEFKQEKTEALLKEYNIIDIESYNKVKNEYLDKVKELESKLENIDSQQEELFKKFELEKIEEDKTKKSLNDLVLDLFDKMKDIKYRTPEELINIKKELKLLKKAN